MTWPDLSLSRGLDRLLLAANLVRQICQVFSSLQRSHETAEWKKRQHITQETLLVPRSPSLFWMWESQNRLPEETCRLILVPARRMRKSEAIWLCRTNQSCSCRKLADVSDWWIPLLRWMFTNARWACGWKGTVWLTVFVCLCHGRVLWCKLNLWTLDMTRKKVADSQVSGYRACNFCTSSNSDSS